MYASTIKKRNLILKNYNLKVIVIFIFKKFLILINLENII